MLTSASKDGITVVWTWRNESVWSQNTLLSSWNSLAINQFVSLIWRCPEASHSQVIDIEIHKNGTIHWWKKTLCLKQVRQVSKTVAFQCPRWNCINFYWELTLSSLTAPATLKGEEVGVIAVAPQTEVGPSDGISLACVQYELGLCELHSARAQLIPLIIHIGHLHRQKWQDGWAKKNIASAEYDILYDDIFYSWCHDVLHQIVSQ